MALVELKQLSVCYGAFRALNGVSFAIEGGAVGLLGPNGAGKSTLLKTLLGFLKPDAGEALLFGKPMPEYCLEARQRLGYMPEKAIVSPKISAVSFLTYCGRLFGMTRVDAMERAHEVLNYVGMGENRYRKMETYSTGMCQRVKFAQALIHDPKLLLLDEPTNGLDPEGRIEMLELIRELATKRKVTVMLSSHLMPDVEQVCDRVIVMKRGAVITDASLASLTAVKQGLFEVRVRDNNQDFAGRLEARGCLCRLLQSGDLLVEKPAAIDDGVFFELAHEMDTQVRYLKPVRKSLENVFMEAIAETKAG